jgi:hypothetical protein
LRRAGGRARGPRCSSPSPRSKAALRSWGRPAVQLHQVALGPAADEPGMAEVMAEPVREHLDAALPTAADGDLVHAAGGHRPPVANPEPNCAISALSSRSRRAAAAEPRQHLRNPCALVAAQWRNPAWPVASWIGEGLRFCQRRPVLSQRPCAGAQPSGPRLCTGLPHARPRSGRRGGPGPPRRRGVRARDRAPVHLAPDLASRP